MATFFQHLRESYRNINPEAARARLVKLRREPSVSRIDKPTRLDRAHALGYKAKKGYIIVRVKLPRGGRQRPKFRSGRRPKHYRRVKILSMNYQWVAEQRANKKFPNCEVLNSYFLAKDGIYYWYEVILVDRIQVSRYNGMEWLSNPANRGRVFRGLTSAARKSRGLRSKGEGAEKIRPSLRAKKGLAH